jgi:2-polyprenyl-3-methyl-5-hydroxy-6-metoxy-1,4-benzoquinol methylase
MDELTKYNVARWKALVEANALFTRPKLSLDLNSARQMLDPEERLGDIASKDVLCLACGGGQQSVAFALLNANVTVFDLSEGQLNRDREAAAHYDVEIKTLQGDMQDLSRFEKASFDIVYHGYSLGFVPNARSVFQQVARVLRANGMYHFGCANPFFLGMQETDWNGEGYTIRYPYINGAEITYDDQEWVYDRSNSSVVIPPPREFRHTLSTLISGLVEAGFVIQHVSDYSSLNPDPNAEPGTWDHFVAIAPPWLTFWSNIRNEGYS